MKKNFKKSEEGFATLETVALVSVFLILISYSVGMFGVIHSAILNSIAARTYAWETFNHRTNVQYFRDNRGSNGPDEHYRKFGFRAHGIASEKQNSDTWQATERGISKGISIDPAGRSSQVHNDLLAENEIPKREARQRVNPVWIKTVYGICLDSECGGVKP